SSRSAGSLRGASESGTPLSASLVISGILPHLKVSFPYFSTMRRATLDLPPPPGTPPPARAHSDRETLRRLLPYLWRYRWRVVLALSFMVGAKLANVGVPLLLKKLIDSLSIPTGDPRAVLVVPIGLLLAYGGLRL